MSEVTVIKFSAEKILLNNVRVYENENSKVVKANIKATRIGYNDSGTPYSAFVGSRQVTFITKDGDNTMLEFALKNLAPDNEYIVNISGYETSTPDKKVKGKWYDNHIVQECEIVK